MKWLPNALKRIRGNIIITILILLLSHGAGGNPAQCIYKNCNAIKEGMLNVHLVAHSHDDVGWLKTLEQYYDGSGLYNSIAGGPVRAILNTATEELGKSPDRKFIYVEMAFFWRWWNEIDEEKKAQTRALIENGQLEFTSGGWSMNDEATAHYVDTIQQFTLGLRFLNDTFGPCATPRIAWQIDTFGHSKEQAALSAAMGFDAMFFGRLDYNDKKNRLEKRAMEMMWEGDRLNFGKKSWLFTSVLFNLYQPPSGFCFDVSPCYAPDLIDRGQHKRLYGEASSLKEKIDDFIRQAQDWAQPYRTQNILMTMGSDFTYVNSKRWFDNLDILIKEVNERQKEGLKVNLIYSTPGCYLQEVNRENLTWSMKTDDFFPYASEPNTYWTGFYTSRPTFKYFVRKATGFLQGCQQLAVAAEGREDFLPNIFVLEEALGVAQHHDAITGTSRQHVIDDYTLKLDEGVKACQKVISIALRKIESEQDLTVDDSTQPLNDYNFCPLMNISSCPISESQTEFVLSVYNPLARNVSNSFIRIPVSSSGPWKVEDANGEIHSQLFPIPDPVRNIPGREGNATNELVFKADIISGLSVKKFKISRVDEENPQLEEKPQMAVKKGPFIEDFFDISNSLGMTLTFSGRTGLLTSIKNGDQVTSLSQNYYYYEASKYGIQRSGAYIFEPSDDEPNLITSTTTYHVVQGRDVMEVHQRFNDWLSQVIRVYLHSPVVEIEWLAGPIPTDNGYVGREVVTRFSTDMATQGAFYTDANGRQLVKRKRNKRRTFTFDMNEPVAGNYYPVNTHLMMTEGKRLKNNRKTLILLTDRAQGGTSLRDGELEIMLHRRLLSDDNKGMSEALNERNYNGQGLVARGKLWLIIAGEGTGTHNSIHRTLAKEIFMEKILLFRKPTAINSELFSVPTKFSMLSEVLPPNCHLLTLQPISSTKFLIRFEHFYERTDHTNLSKPALIPYKNLKEVLNFRWIRETTLGANQWADEASRLDWKTREGQQNSRFSNRSLTIEPFITLSPFQIRTFIFEI